MANVAFVVSIEISFAGNYFVHRLGSTEVFCDLIRFAQMNAHCLIFSDAYSRRINFFSEKFNLHFTHTKKWNKQISLYRSIVV